MIFTTSWDDGHVLDNKLCELLNKYQIKGTFFLSKNYLEEPLHDDEIVQISNFHEIGAHTINHPHLSQLDFNCQYKEINQSKIWLENLLNKKCQGFC